MIDTRILPVVRIDLHPYGVIAEVTGHEERLHLLGRFWFHVFSIRRAEQHRAAPQSAFEETLCGIEFEAQELRADPRHIRVGESVIANLVAFVDNALEELGVEITIKPDDEERRWHLFAVEYLKHLGGIERVRPIVEGQGDLVLICSTPARDHIRGGIGSQMRRRDQARWRVINYLPRAIAWRGRDF